MLVMPHTEALTAGKLSQRPALACAPARKLLPNGPSADLRHFRQAAAWCAQRRVFHTCFSHEGRLQSSQGGTIWRALVMPGHYFAPLCMCWGRRARGTARLEQLELDFSSPKHCWHALARAAGASPQASALAPFVQMRDTGDIVG
jgi:hypothetical protein